MPRIRKKTSKRQKTQDRRKLQHKISEGRRKKNKAAKANPQWKSKHKKDPGIPSDFPYKDQILAEVAEQRRLAAEERERRKQEKKLLKASQKAEGTGQNADPEQQQEKGGEGDEHETKRLNLQIGGEEVANLSAKTISTDKLRQRNHDGIEEVGDEEEDEVPVLLNRDLPNLKAVLDEVDVLIKILDARDPLPFRSQRLEDLMATENKKVLLVLNKIDTCPREALVSWVTYLRTQHPTFLFRSATAFLPSTLDQTYQSKSKGNGRPSANDGVGVESILGWLGEWAKGKGESDVLTIGVVGLTNSGKSSFLNTLLGSRALPVYSSTSSSSTSPSTTLLPQEVVIDVSGQKFRFIDTPGLTWISGKDDALRQRDILLRSRGRIDRLKDPVPAVTHIVSRSNPEDLMLLYNLPAFARGDTTTFLSGLARSRNLVKKKGQLDLNGACKVVLRDWSTDKFPRYTTPPSADSSLGNRYDRDDAILATLKTRKDIRKQGGIVKLSPGDMESREAELEISYAKEDDSEAEEEDENYSEVSADQEGNSSENGSGEGTEVESDEAMEEESGDAEDDDGGDVGIGEHESKRPSSKDQKRKRNAESTDDLPKKRVTFAHELKGAKQAFKGTLLKKTQVAPKKVVAVSAAAKNIKISSRVANSVGSKSKAKIAVDGEAYNFGKYF